MAKEITLTQFREAERTLGKVLRRKFPRSISDSAKDILSQVSVEYLEWLEHNPPARSPVAWLLNGAYWRAVNLFDAEKRRPRSASLDSVFYVADDSAPTVEQHVVNNDLRERLHQALSHLSDRERKLVEMVYLEGMSIREAGRELNWQKSAADRHHKAAMEKMEALMIGDWRAPLDE